MKTIICLFILLTITHAHASNQDESYDKPGLAFLYGKNWVFTPDNSSKTDEDTNELTVNFLYGKPWIEVYSSDEVIEIHCESIKSEDKKEISACDKFGKINVRKRK